MARVGFRVRVTVGVRVRVRVGVRVRVRVFNWLLPKGVIRIAHCSGRSHVLINRAKYVLIQFNCLINLPHLFHLVGYFNLLPICAQNV